MSIDRIVIDQAKQTNMIDLAGRYTTLRREAAKEYSGPCPLCGGKDRFHVKPDAWFCRKCHPDFGDAIDFVRWLENIDFTGAIERLTGHVAMRTMERVIPTPTITSNQPKPAGWLDKAAAIVEQAHDFLMDGGPGSDYLLSRQIQPETWVMFKLGYAGNVSLPDTHGKQRKPAIVIPWYRKGALTAIRYRFLEMHEYLDSDDEPRRAKQTALKDSDFAGILYGGQAIAGCAEDLRTLVLCEGELNALSIWQTCHDWNWDVLSLGSESARLTPGAIDYAKKFERAIVWMDKPDIAKATMAMIPGAYGISSPGNQDANDMLQTGILGGFLATARFQACQTAVERERLLWNLYDAAQLPCGIDDGTRQVMESIAKGLGKEL